ncbi:MAG: His/Gly/Thr/Pro-type tRNA ligase C-terminal domain-containing protein, partial [Fuerstiella sp.]
CELGLANLRELFQAVSDCGLPEGRVVLDVSIARGLDYYTGTIYETFLGDLPGIGSVCSGGRYDNLAEKFTSQKLPGVGASLGLDRMLAAMEELGMTETAATPAPVLITMFERDRASSYIAMARRLRAAGIGVEVFPDAKGIGKQMKYADRKGFKVALIAGADEFAAGNWQIKGLADGSQKAVADNDVVDVVKSLLTTDKH